MKPNLEIISQLNKDYGVPYTMIETLMDLPKTTIAGMMTKAGYAAATKGSDFRKSLTDEQVGAIKEAYLLGVPSPLLAVIAGVSAPTIRYHVGGLRGRVLSNEQKEVIIRLRELGVPVGDIAVLANVHPASIIAICRGKNE